MAATNMPAGTWQPGATITLYPYLGDTRPSLGGVSSLASGAASAAGALVLTVTASPNQPLSARGLGPDGVVKTVTTYAL